MRGASVSHGPSTEREQGRLGEARMSEERRCPRCGEPIVNVLVVGPHEGYVAPCECRIVPEEV
ncbi:hypothetical protein BRC81_03655 [Halobacteriales archaeon QS_1_68_20]|nr:MAG: hypothetical protein BRC81_03655 [Halobacteriales archaeon QS_1_68_20]